MGTKNHNFKWYKSIEIVMPKSFVHNIPQRRRNEVESAKTGQEVEKAKTGNEVETAKKGQEDEAAKTGEGVGTAKTGQEVQTVKRGQEVDNTKVVEEGREGPPGQECWKPRVAKHLR